MKRPLVIPNAMRNLPGRIASYDAPVSRSAPAERFLGRPSPEGLPRNDRTHIRMTRSPLSFQAQARNLPEDLPRERPLAPLGVTSHVCHSSSFGGRTRNLPLPTQTHVGSHARKQKPSPPSARGAWSSRRGRAMRRCLCYFFAAGVGVGAGRGVGTGVGGTVITRDAVATVPFSPVARTV